MSKSPILKDDERDAVVNGLAHGLAFFERAPSHWVRIGETEIVREIIERLAPPERRQSGDAATPTALRVARKHVAKLFK